MVDIPAIETTGLGRIYKIRGAKKSEQKELVALQDVSLQVHTGELFGLLGPNGAGKTTLIKILTTLLAPTSGSARVVGLDVSKNPEAVRQRINMVSGGEASGYGLLTVRENLWMFAQFYGIPTDEANRRIKTLLEIVGISDRANTRSSNLSTGLRQKMNIVRGFLTDPQVLFLDEPTLGLDVGAARDVRRFIRNWMDDDLQRSILLTTHYLVEAEELCDRVGVMDHGKIMALDTPRNLVRNLGAESKVLFRVDGRDVAAAEFMGLPTVSRVEKVEDGFVIYARDASVILQDLLRFADARKFKLSGLRTEMPRLDDVFLTLTGRELRE